MKHQATPYFSFNGQAKEALAYYKDVFDGEILSVMTFGEADFPSPPEMSEHIMHAQFKKGELFFMMSDSFPGQETTAGNHISLVLELESEEEIQHYYRRLTEKGTVVMELQDTFWGAVYAKVKDPYGIHWDLNYTKK
ncbi:VOC family protein [Bacillus sp. KH172YL63]|uniref:VOC family protein n=1 Tax=Bacillus sp. KH172YL63 TaxID=2709784 RepID=UPI0013E4312B|nr:VOC family protein [Bacillus sp. KH172YL63]BCB05547.1 VOC family protein [Bacillus sp. KH172YL63]